MRDKDTFVVERQAHGDYAVRRWDSQWASDVLPTQAKAIERARELGHGKTPLVERVRRTSGGNPDKWRPMPHTETRDDRIELRTTREEKRLIAEAAAREQLDVTRFIMRSVLPVAREVVRRSERIVLSERDSKRVLELLDKPPRPTASLIAAAKRRAKV
jgi:uncharacterized protein (DUF1778 family)